MLFAAEFEIHGVIFDQKFFNLYLKIWTASCKRALGLKRGLETMDLIYEIGIKHGNINICNINLRPAEILSKS